MISLHIKSGYFMIRIWLSKQDLHFLISTITFVELYSLNITFEGQINISLSILIIMFMIFVELYSSNITFERQIKSFLLF